MERQLFTAQGRPAHTQCGRSLRHHVINQPNFCKASPWLPFPLGRQRPGCRVQGRGPGPWQADPLPLSSPTCQPPGEPPHLISPTSPLGWFEEVLREEDRGLQVFGDLAPEVLELRHAGSREVQLVKDVDGENWGVGGTPSHAAPNPRRGKPAQTPVAPERPRRAVPGHHPL